MRTGRGGRGGKGAACAGAGPARPSESSIESEGRRGGAVRPPRSYDCLRQRQNAST